MRLALKSAHFQLTRQCNLNCRFCGQAKGMANGNENELSLEFWLNVAEQIKNISEEQTPSITLWGGEPLLFRQFDDLAAHLKKMGFRIGVVTNGTLIDLHLESLSEIDEIYVSVDGREALNDAVRGEGTWGRIEHCLNLLKDRHGTLNCLVTVSDSNVSELADIPNQLAVFRPDRVILGPLMYLSGEEIRGYREFSIQAFGCDYPELEVWRRDDDHLYQEMLRCGLDSMKTQVYPMEVVFTPHADSHASHCIQPWQRIHIRHDGEVGFCTDYFNFSAGNLLKHPLKEIFYGELAETFRRAVREDSLATCRHCPWRVQV